MNSHMQKSNEAMPPGRMSDFSDLFKEQLNKVMEENKELREQIGRLNKKNGELEIDLDTVKLQGAKNLSGTITQLQEKMKKSQEDFKTFKNDMITQKKNNEQRQKDSQFSEQRKSFDLQLNKAKCQITQLSKQVTNLKEQNLNLQSYKTSSIYLTTIQRQNDELVKKNESLSTDMIKVQEVYANKFKKHLQWKKKLEENVDKLQKSQQRKEAEEKAKKDNTDKLVKETSQKLTVVLQILLEVKKLEKTVPTQEFKREIQKFEKMIPLRADIIKKSTGTIEGQKLKNQFNNILSCVYQDKEKHQRYFQKQFKPIESENIKYKNEINYLQGIVDQMSDENIKTTNQIQQIKRNHETAIKKKDSQISQLKGTNIKATKQLNQSLLQQRSKFETLQENLQEKLKLEVRAKQKLMLQSTACNKTIQEQKTYIQDLQKHYQSKKRSIVGLQQKIKILDLQKSKLQSSEQVLQKHGRELTNKNKNLEVELNSSRTKILQLEKMVKNYSAQLERLKEAKAELEVNLKDRQAEIISFRTELQKTKSILVDTKMNLSMASSEIKQLQKVQSTFILMNTKLLPELSYYIGRQKIQLDVEEPENSVEETLGWFKSKYNQLRYFGESEIIQRQNIDFIVKEIKNFTNSFVVQTKLLYRFDVRNTLNFHHFIDLKENLFVVVRLINNITIGGFSCFPLERIEKDKVRKSGIGKGFIFSLTHSKVFPMKKDPRMPVMTFDEFFFIFGNSELRIRSQQKKFFSNFGVAAATFQSNGFTRSQFLNVNDSTINEMDIIGYEFYQIKFKL